MEVYDKDGNLVEGFFSQAELDAKLEEERQKFTKKDNEPPANDKKTDEMPDWAKTLVQKVDSLSSHNQLTQVNRVVSGLDADKANEVKVKYDSLTGYAETPEGLARRAEDAYLLATGSRYDAGAIDMSNLAGAGGKSNVAPVETKKIDADINAALGNTPEDIAKYGAK